MKILSAIQMNPKLAMCKADVTYNIQQSEELVHEAWKMGTNFLVFPELCMTGYTFLSAEEAFRVSEPISTDPRKSPTFFYMTKVARELATYVAWGFIEYNEKDSTLHNSAILMSPQGEVISCYRKINLWAQDFIWAKPGGKAPDIAKTELGNVAVVICRDLRDKVPDNIPKVAGKSPPLFKDKKIDLVAGCVNWGKGGGFPPSTWMDFVADNKCTMVVADRWGVEENNHEVHGRLTNDFGQGKSCVITPGWEVRFDGLVFEKNSVVTVAIP